MLNRTLGLLLIILSIASCSSSKKNNEVTSSPKINQDATQKDGKAQPAVVGDVAIFSIPEKQLKKSEVTTQVIYFDTNSAELNNEAVSKLNDKVVPEAINSKTKKIVIEAHCDERGSKAYNQKLSKKRAKSVKNYLIKNGAKAANIRTVGYGESKPVALGHDEESWSKNRRAITIIIKK